MSAPTSDARREEELARLRREVVAAEDARILRVVRYVDSLPARGEADALIAPLRPRLEVLRPPRPLSLTRLLFVPLDPLIVPAERWRPGAPGIPRTALLPLSGVVTERLGPVGARVQARIAGRQTSEIDAVIEAGGWLWPAAAAVLGSGEALGSGDAPVAPAGAGGLDAAVAALAGPIAAVLAHGTALYRLAQQPDAPADAWETEPLLAAAAQHSALALEMMLAVLLAQTLDAGHLLRLAEDVAERSRHPPPDRALDFVLGAYGDTGGAGDGMAAGTDAIRRAAIMLDGMERRKVSRPAQTEKLDRLRRRLDRTCRQRFEARAERLQCIAPSGPEPVADAEVNGIEFAALELRRLEAVARRVSGAGFDDAPLRRAADHLARAVWLNPVDRLRLAEILLGPEAALALAEQAGIGGDA
jgi:hypothetical protein